MRCRTSALGSHKLKCDKCGYKRIEYDSCCNRHCPKCQGAKRPEWVEKRLAELLPVAYYHSVFTLPHTLNLPALYNMKIIYDIFLASCGGISTDGKKWINLSYRKKFLFPVKAMSMRMRKIFSEKLQRAYDDGKLVFPEKFSCLKEPENFKHFLNRATWDKWINYTKKPFSSPEKVVKYIGHYTHRVAISNQRIIDIANGKITFKYRDYKDSNVISKMMTISAEEFIRRFLLHILPKGFKKIRHFGIFGSGLRKRYIQLAKDLLHVVKSNLNGVSTAIDTLLEKLFRCPNCQSGVLHLTGTFLSYKLHSDDKKWARRVVLKE